jgi:hypothetical protein
MERKDVNNRPYHTWCVKCFVCEKRASLRALDTKFFCDEHMPLTTKNNRSAEKHMLNNRATPRKAYQNYAPPASVDRYSASGLTFKDKAL